MLPKTPKPAIWKLIKGGATALFIVEAIGFACSYGVYYRMNTDRDFRLYINQNYPFVLNYYYKVGEFLGDTKTRQLDNAHWSANNTRKLD